MVHGGCVSIGCYAMTDPAVEEIYSLAYHALKNGQRFFRVHIFPFELTNNNLKQYQSTRWFDFWSNLKEGYDWFETYRKPPNVEVKGGRYVFSQS